MARPSSPSPSGTPSPELKVPVVIDAMGITKTMIFTSDDLIS